MSTGIRVKRICEHCGEEFTAHTTVTRFCSSRCSSGAAKARERAARIKKSNQQTQQVRLRPIEEIKAKEFLTVREAASLLSLSIRTVYSHIDSGKLWAVNLSHRQIRIRRSDIDKLFEPRAETLHSLKTDREPMHFDIDDSYSIGEVQRKFGISEKGLHALISRNGIPKLQQGRHVYVPRLVIDRIFNE